MVATPTGAERKELLLLWYFMRKSKQSFEWQEGVAIAVGPLKASPGLLFSDEILVKSLDSGNDPC